GDGPGCPAVAGKTGPRRCWPSRGFDGSIMNWPRKILPYAAQPHHQTLPLKGMFLSREKDVSPVPGIGSPCAHAATSLLLTRHDPRRAFTHAESLCSPMRPAGFDPARVALPSHRFHASSQPVPSLSATRHNSSGPGPAWQRKKAAPSASSFPFVNYLPSAPMAPSTAVAKPAAVTKPAEVVESDAHPERIPPCVVRISPARISPTRITPARIAPTRIAISVVPIGRRIAIEAIAIRSIALAGWPIAISPPAVRSRPGQQIDPRLFGIELLGPHLRPAEDDLVVLLHLNGFVARL